jgi:hypothetical protein
MFVSLKENGFGGNFREKIKGFYLIATAIFSICRQVQIKPVLIAFHSAYFKG